MRPVVSAPAIEGNGNSMNLAVDGSPPCLAIHAKAPTCVMFLSPLPAIVFPLRSLPVLIGEVFVTTSAEVGAVFAYCPAGATITMSSPCWCAAASETTFDCATSTEPPETAAMIAPPLEITCTWASIPAVLKKP